RSQGNPRSCSPRLAGVGPYSRRIRSRGEGDTCTGMHGMTGGRLGAWRPYGPSNRRRGATVTAHRKERITELLSCLLSARISARMILSKPYCQTSPAGLPQQDWLTARSQRKVSEMFLTCHPPSPRFLAQTLSPFSFPFFHIPVSSRNTPQRV